MSCTNCSLSCGHPRDNWWSPGQIKYCWAQIMFLLSNYGNLEANHWPVDPKITAVNVDLDIQDTQWGSDLKPVSDIKSELDRRIYGWNALYGESERRFGGLAKFQLKLLFDVDWCRDWWSLSPEARNIVKYLSGGEPKMMDYTHWQAGRQRDKESHKKVVSEK